MRATYLRRRGHLTLVGLVGLGGHSGVSLIARGPVGALASFAGVEPALRDELTDALGRSGVPGCVVAVTDRSSTLDVLAYGSASFSPPRPASKETVFHLFSGTKLYTATALMVLVEQGVVDLDAPIQRYLPSLGLEHDISVRQLAAHDSGLADTLRAFVSVHRAGDRAPSTGEALARFRLDKAGSPGGGATYRNVNYAILGELITQCSGRAYAEFVKRSVLEPLDADADFSYPPDFAERQATGFMPRWSPLRPAMRWLMPGARSWITGEAEGRLVSLTPFCLDTEAIGGLVGSAPGFLPLLREMLSGDDGLLRATSKREMLTLQAPGAAGITSRDGVGLAWKLGTAAGVEFWNHEGGGPGFCSETRIYPSAGLGVVVLMNLSQSKRLSTVCHRLCETIRLAIAR
jgi:D-alanyl-D-alanine carboxypeptidase